MIVYNLVVSVHAAFYGVINNDDDDDDDNNNNKKKNNSLIDGCSCSVDGLLLLFSRAGVRA